MTQRPLCWSIAIGAALLQVVPALAPGEAKEWKRPALNNWRDLQNELVDDATFDSWFGPQGLHKARTNIGILTGKCSGDVFVVDLDEIGRAHV